MTGAKGDADRKIGAVPATSFPAILVVEDEVLVRLMIADALRNAGYLVIEASNAQEALDVLQHNNVDVRALFTDVRMPGAIDGTELAHIVRSDFPSIKIVLASGDFTVMERIKHDGFFRKPYHPEHIIRHFKTLVD